MTNYYYYCVIVTLLGEFLRLSFSIEPVKLIILMLYRELVLPGTMDCNKLLAAKVICLRLILTMASNNDI